VLEAVRALEAGGPSEEQVEAASRRVAHGQAPAGT
jgi:hypothetical protein